MVLNTEPVVDSVNMPLQPQQVNTDIPAIAYFNDPDDTHTALWDWGDGTTSNGIVDEQTGSETSGTVTGKHSYTEPGVYRVTITLTDRYGACASDSWKYVVVYEPDCGTVSGSGFIMSPLGAYLPDPTIEGKASFGLTAKYNKDVSTGNALFILEKAKTKFTASYFDWIINRDGKAMIHGYGKFDKADGYSFLLIVTDGKITGDADTYRMIIWDPAGDFRNDAIAPIYDNGDGAILNPAVDPIVGGSIVIK